MIDKKITTIQPLQASWGIPDPSLEWSNDSFVNFTRLLRSDAYHINDVHTINLNSDIYFISSYDIANIDKEIEFAKHIKSLGKKLVLSFSQDLRFLVGWSLVNDRGIHYGELCKYADVILSGVGSGVKCYGRYQHKVIDFGLPFERLNFSKIPFEHRNCDVLVANNLGEENWGITCEVLLGIKEALPDKRICYSTQLEPHRISQEIKEKIDIIPPGLINHLPYSRIFVSPEPRPRPGRGILEAFYCRTPFVSCETTYHSRLFPDYTFKVNSIYDLIDNTVKLFNTDYYSVIAKAEQLAEYDYFDNFWIRLRGKLYE